MRKLVALLVFLFFAISACARTDADLKTDAVNATLGGVADLRYAAMDDFFSNDSHEYVIISLDQTPAFLLRLEAGNGTYNATLVRDNATIQSIIEERYDRLLAPNLTLADAQARIAQDLDEFNRSRFFYEAKYDLFFGLDNGTCQNRSDCEQTCNQSTVCRYARDQNGAGIIDDMMAYVQNVQDIDAQIGQAQGLGTGARNMSELENLDAYAQTVGILQNLTQQMAASRIQNEDSLLYSGPIRYNTTPFADAQSAVEDARGPLIARANARSGWESIQRATGQLAPEPPQIRTDANASQAAQVKNDTQGAAAAGNGPDLNATAPNENSTAQKIVVVEQPVYQRDFFSLENIAVVTAAVVLIVLAIEGALLIRRRLKEGQHL